MPVGGWHPGVPGGIPTNYTMFCNVRVSIPRSALVAVGDGVADDAPAIQAAINACPNGQFVYIPAGTYRLNSAIWRAGDNTGDNVQHPYSIVIRGDGPTKTRLLGYGTSGSIIELHAWGTNSQRVNISSGNVRGSTSIVIASSPSFLSNNSWVSIFHDNTEAGATNEASYMTNCTSQLVKVTNKVGTTLTISPALNAGYASDLVSVNLSPPFRCGIEDLYVERMSASGMHNIFLEGAAECWIKNVESARPIKWNVRLQSCAACEIRHSYFHDTSNGGGDSGYGVGLFQYSCNNLVEDNIFVRCRHSMILEDGGQNNVFGYNYSKDPINENQSNTDYLMGDQITHGGRPQFNLWEGNVAATIKFDCVLGSSLNNTVFRCLIQRKGLPSTYVACFAADVQKLNYNANLVGLYYEAPPSKSSATTYRWGSNQDDRSNLDPKSQSTAYLHGIFDVQTGSTTWDSTNSDHILPSSLYLGSKPSSWDSGPWPAIGPDCSPMNGGNPAMRRWTGGGGGVGPPSVVPPSAAITAIIVK
jgi:hypothetical protein